MLKVILSLFLLASFIQIQSQTIAGVWKIQKGETEIRITINEGTGTITWLSSTKDLTEKIIGGAIYSDIKPIDKLKWSATRHFWEYYGVSRENKDKGWWTEAGKTVLTLSPDGNILSASEHWTWTRLNPLSGNSTPTIIAKENVANNESMAKADGTERTVFNTTYNCIEATYKLYISENKKDTTILAFYKNTHALVSASIHIVDRTYTQKQITLNPGEQTNMVIKGSLFDVLVDYYPYDPAKFEKDVGDQIIDWIKEKVRQQIIIEKKPDDPNTVNFGIRG